MGPDFRGAILGQHVKFTASLVDVGELRRVESGPGPSRATPERHITRSGAPETLSDALPIDGPTATPAISSKNFKYLRMKPIPAFEIC